MLQVNGQSLLGSSHQEAVRALRSVGDKMAITVCDGFDPSSLDISSPDTPSSPVGFAASPTHHSSISSIDREDEYTSIVKQVSYQYCTKLLTAYDNYFTPPL